MLWNIGMDLLHDVKQTETDLGNEKRNAMQKTDYKLDIIKSSKYNKSSSKIKQNTTNTTYSNIQQIYRRIFMIIYESYSIFLKHIL